MPVHLYQIAAFSDDQGTLDPAKTYVFNEMRGVVNLASEQIETLRRRGVDQVGVRMIGNQPEVTQLTCMWWQADWAAAKTAIENLKALKGIAHGVQLTKESIDYGQFDITIVLERQSRAVASVVGAAGDPQVQQEVTISLIRRGDSPQPPP